MIIDCISDLHGNYPELGGGDLLIVAGDLTGNDSTLAWDIFDDWFCHQPYKKKVFTAGNHDEVLTRESTRKYIFKTGNYVREKFEFISDSGTEFQGLKIWGSPWTKRFEGMNPDCMAFTCDTDEELAEKWALIPDDIDILITHSPPYGIMDIVRSYDYITGKSWVEHTGSASLARRVEEIRPKLHVYGHIHEGYGQDANQWGLGGTITQYVNASHMTREYEAINKPIRVIL